MDQAIYRDGRAHRVPATSATSWTCCGLDRRRLPLDRAEGPHRRGVRPRQPGARAAPAGRRGRRQRPPAGQDRGLRGSCSWCSRPLRYVEETSRHRDRRGDALRRRPLRRDRAAREGNPLAGVRQRLEHDAEHARPTGRSRCCTPSWTRSSTTTPSSTPRCSEDLEQIEEQVFSGGRRRRRHRRSTGSSARSWSSGGPPCRWPTPLSALVSDHAEPRSCTSRRGRSSATSPTTCCSVNDHVESYDRLLTDVLSAHLAQISVQQNDDMRRISAWVAIAAVPTMIAGIYGMNFDNMPELQASFDVGGARVLLRLLRRARRHGRRVPGALPRVQALRLALSARSRSRSVAHGEQRRQDQQHRRRPGDVGQDRRRARRRTPGAAAPAPGPASRRRTPASGCRWRRSPRRRRPWRSSTGCATPIAANSAPRKKTSSAMPLTTVISSTSGSEPYAGVGQHVLGDSRAAAGSRARPGRRGRTRRRPPAPSSDRGHAPAGAACRGSGCGPGAAGRTASRRRPRSRPAPSVSG